MQWAQSLQYGHVGRAYLGAFCQRPKREHGKCHANEVLSTALRVCLLLLTHAHGRTLESQRWHAQELAIIYVDAADMDGRVEYAFMDGRVEYFAVQVAPTDATAPRSALNNFDNRDSHRCVGGAGRRGRLI